MAPGSGVPPIASGGRHARYRGSVARITTYHLLLYAIVTGAVATAAGLLTATFWTLPFTPYTVWIWTTGILVVLAGLCAPPVIRRALRAAERVSALRRERRFAHPFGK